MTTDLTIVIVNYKVKELVMKLLDSVYAQVRGISFEVYLIDNASDDWIVVEVAKRFPDVNVIANDRNLGFATACNQGIRRAAGRHVLLLNPDTELIEDAPSAMVREADANPDVGVIGCRVLNADRSLQRSVLGFPTVRSQVAVMLKLHHLAPWLPCLKRYFLPDFDYSRTQDVDQVIGAAFMITRSALDKVGLMDEKYFIWFEEVDYCRSVRDAGLKIRYLSDTSIIHHGGQSFGQLLALPKQRLWNRSLGRYMRKHGGIARWLIVESLMPLSLVLAWIVGILGIKRRRYA